MLHDQLQIVVVIVLRPQISAIERVSERLSWQSEWRSEVQKWAPGKTNNNN